VPETDTSSVHILGLGASTPVGRNVWASAAAVRAGLSGFSEHPFMVDSVGEPVRVASCRWLDAAYEGGDRYCALLFTAIDEALAAVQKRDQSKSIRLGLAAALPPARPGRPEDLSSTVIAAASKRYGELIGRTLTFEFGHAAGYVAMDGALRSLAAGSIDACVVAGVDSYLPPETLEWVEACDQLHGAGALNNAWGFIPGEAAGAVLLASARVATLLEAHSFGEVIAVGLGRETNLIKTETVCTGEGLTAAFRAALEKLDSGQQIHNVLCDLNGEIYRADEFGFTALRTKERFRAATDFIAPADVWGDVGAAGAPLHLSLAVIAHRKRYGNGPLSLTWASSESGERGAAIIRAHEAERD